ncbi:hypothetical protein GFS24_15300 [Chitinophaga sp. SYP-B3965]|uniref:hypothetical protein n=1 Tax=Chitinophaga sp. SYP-B3965 TaxID=2663120 RepID=UPI0012996C3F|nr:hypothetical protein [Chitinophaga sp. SYP-B3965]MRG46488.1 hypothetical protein [Chitinophaga sp. SYP-B3965]
MEILTIKRTTRDLPMMILIVIIFLFPGVYMMYLNGPTSVTFIFAALFNLLILGIAAYGFVAIFKKHAFFVLSKDGLVSRYKNERRFYNWEDIRSYRIEAEMEQYYSEEMNSHQSRKYNSIVLTLQDDSSIRISIDKLSKELAEIIKLLGLYKGA